jgi:serine protease Do
MVRRKLSVLLAALLVAESVGFAAIFSPPVDYLQPEEPKQGQVAPENAAPAPSPEVAPPPPPPEPTEPEQAEPPRPSTRPRLAIPASRPSIQELPPIPKPEVLEKPAVEGQSAVPYSAVDSLDELRSLERQVEETSRKVIPATVGLQIGASSGSGVIVSPDGWVLTAGHVSDEPGQPVTIIMHDGKRVRGITLGGNKSVDSGLIRILDPGPWPYAQMGTSQDLSRGQWLVAIGHPGGYRVGRSPVVRLGRLTGADATTLTTDNTLVGGDSGGPLYDLDGRVVGIHSRISQFVTVNMHVPVDQYVKDWDRIAKGESWGNLGPRMPQIRLPYLGMTPENADGGVRVRAVTTGSPADKAGLRSGDLITKIDGRDIRNQMDVISILQRRAQGQVIAIEVTREGAENQTIRVRLGAPLAGNRPPGAPRP